MGTPFFGSDGPARFTHHVPRDYSLPAEDDLVIQSLSRSQWRVSDRRYPEHDAIGLLGFIEEKDDTFELMQLENGFQWFSFSSLAEAIAHFTQAPPQGSLVEPELSWSPRSA